MDKTNQRSLPSQSDVADNNKDFVNSIAKGIDVLKSFDHSTPRQTSSEVAAACDISRAAARRILLTFTALGYANTNGKYFWLSPKLLELGYSYLSSMQINDSIQPVLERLCKDLQETCAVGVLDGTEVIYIARFNGPRMDRLNIKIGERLPVYVSSAGRILLAALSTTEREKYISRIEFKKYSNRTIHSKRELRKELKLVSEQGFSTVDGEFDVGIFSAAVPIHNKQHEIIGAVTVGGNSARVNQDTLHSEILPKLRNAAANISRIMLNDSLH